MCYKCHKCHKNTYIFLNFGPWFSDNAAKWKYTVRKWNGKYYDYNDMLKQKLLFLLVFDMFQENSLDSYLSRFAFYTNTLYLKFACWRSTSPYYITLKSVPGTNQYWEMRVKYLARGKNGVTWCDLTLHLTANPPITSHLPNNWAIPSYQIHALMANHFWWHV